MLTQPLLFLMQGVTLGLAATSTPGPFQAFLLGQTTQQGLRRTLPLCLAPLMSDGPIIALVLVLLTQLPSGFLKALQVAGGALMLYLASNLFRDLYKRNPSATPIKAQSFYHAVLINFISPWPFIYWSTITGPLFLKAWSHSALAAIGFIGGFYTLLIGGFMVFVVLSATALRLHNMVGQILTVIAALALIGFGGVQIWSGFPGH